MINPALQAFWNGEEGQDMVEYSLLLAFIALAAVGLLSGIKTSDQLDFGRSINSSLTPLLPKMACRGTSPSSGSNGDDSFSPKCKPFSNLSHLKAKKDIFHEPTFDFCTAVRFGGRQLYQLCFYRLILVRVQSQGQGRTVATNRLVVAKHDIQVGSFIQDSDLDEVAWGAPIPEEAIKTRQEAVGRGVVANIYQNEPFLVGKVGAQRRWRRSRGNDSCGHARGSTPRE